MAEITWPGAGDSSYKKIQPLIRFYDQSYKDADNPKGQQTAGRYFVSSIAGHHIGSGLSLYNSEPAWYLDPQACAQVINWINAEMSKRGYKLVGDWLDHHYESLEDPDSPELFTNPERVTKQSKNALLETAFREMLKPYYDQIDVQKTEGTYYGALTDYAIWRIHCKRSAKPLPLANKYQSLYAYGEAVNWRNQIEEWFKKIVARHGMVMRDFSVYGRLRKDPTFCFDAFRWKSGNTVESIEDDEGMTPEQMVSEIGGKIDWQKDLDQALWKFHPYGCGYTTHGSHSQAVISVWTYFPVDRRDEFAEQVRDFAVKWLTDNRIMPIKNVQMSRWETGKAGELSSKTGFVVYVNCQALAAAMQTDARRTSMLPPVQPA